MSVNYRSNSNADVSRFRVVKILTVDIDNLRCRVQDIDRSSSFYVSLNSSVGLFYTIPAASEEWIVEFIGATWFFHSKTLTQNPSIPELSNCNSGDIVLGATGDIRVTSPLVQSAVINTWTSSTSVPFGSVTEIGALSFVDVANTSIATIESSSRLKIITAGTYAVSFEVTPSIITVDRSFVQIGGLGGRNRRGFFHNEDFGRLEVTYPIAVGDILIFSIYHTTSPGPLTFTSRIDITQVR